RKAISREDLPCGPEGVRMGLRGGFDGIRITAAECNDKRNSMRGGCRDDAAIAFLQPGRRKGQASESVGGQRVHAGLIKHDAGIEREDTRQHLIERLQIFFIARAVIELDVNGTALLAKWKIALGVHGKREYLRIALK